MAALKNAVLDSWDDQVAVNVGGSWDDVTSLGVPGFGLYTFVPDHSWNYAGIFDELCPDIGAVTPDIRVYPRVPKERVSP